MNKHQCSNGTQYAGLAAPMSLTSFLQQNLSLQTISTTENTFTYKKSLDTTRNIIYLDVFHQKNENITSSSGSWHSK